MSRGTSIATGTATCLYSIFQRQERSIESRPSESHTRGCGDVTIIELSGRLTLARLSMHA